MAGTTAQLRSWWALSDPPVFIASAEASPQTGIAAGTVVTITTSAVLTGGMAGVYLMDIEIFNAAGDRVFQKYMTSKFEVSVTVTADFMWIPDADGSYKVAVAVFSIDWSTQYIWNDQAALIEVGADSGGGDAGGGDTGGEDAGGSVDAGTWVSLASAVATSGGVVFITAIVMHTGTLSDGLLDLEVHTAAGAQMY